MKTKTDVVIIGGGILGNAVGYELTRAGCSVTLLERGEIAGGASGGNMGQISLLDRNEDWHLSLALESLEVYRQIAADTKNAIDYVETGGTTVLSTKEELAAGEAAAQRLLKHGVGAEILRGEEIRRAEPLIDPTCAHGAVFCAREGRIDPFASTLYFNRAAVSLGMESQTFAAVTGFELSHGRVEAVVTDRGKIRADVVVNAAGAWAGKVAELAGVGIPMRYNRGTALISKKMPRMIRGPVVDGGFLVQAKGDAPLKINLGLNQSRHGSIGLAQATIAKGLEDKGVELDGLVLVARKILDYFPALSALEILRTWSANTPSVPDALPIFGYAAAAANLLHVCGFKGAFTTAPAVAKAVRALVVDGANTLPASFTPDRHAV